ncbi:protein cereblon isoform X1 [Nematostella vectensis]|uniref:protein cereblon isoform X1 n=1 Tax=Nematostella vectensis TaxID=45351 RepID=UPI002077025B|nr:protein cereblon isoform X1 [Nematostella vectensis]
MADDSSSDDEQDIEDGYDAMQEIEEYHGESSSEYSDSGSSPIDNGDGPRPLSIAFDPSLPTRHEYLGEEMDEFSGRTVLEPNNVLQLPLLTLPGLILVPGQTLPLHIFQPQTVAMMKNVIDKDRTFGQVNSRYGSNRNQLLSSIGTTVEIFSMKEEVEAGITTIRIKATGRQRFRIIDIRTQVDGIPQATVQILPEITLSPHPEGGLLSCYSKSGCQATCGGCLPKYHPPGGGVGKPRLGVSRFRKVNTSLSSWPEWVYRLYNPFSLMDEIKKLLLSWNESMRVDNLPICPTEFSFWIAANLPLDDRLRLQILTINCPTQRLRKELSIMQKCSVLCCRDCNSTIAYKNELFSMSLDGPLGAYVNPGGFVHETLTFYKALGIRLRGHPTAENSWFPGYAWTIAECQQCSNHLGWRFSAIKKGLSPGKFWGLTRSSLKPSMKDEGITDDS